MIQNVEKLLHDKTQNSNKSFNGTIFGTGTFFSPNAIEFSVYDAAEINSILVQKLLSKYTKYLKWNLGI